LWVLCLKLFTFNLDGP